MTAINDEVVFNRKNFMTAIDDEVVFKRMLCLERRRSERTEARFGLVLIDIEPVNPALSGPIIHSICLTVAAAMRETDITGWYRERSVLGVILTTLNGAERNTVKSVVVERIRAILRLNLDDDQMRQVSISCHIFPEDDEANRIFYSESDTKDLSRKNPALLKRTIDIVGSLAALIVLLPLFLAIAAAIRLTSTGPVLFRQTRIGQFGKQFRFLKFRSMVVDNDPSIHKEYIRKLMEKELDSSSKAFKLTKDPRVTKIGRFLRKSSLDELPQFLNVLKGDMSLVGPRPPIPYEFERYSLWHRRRALEAKPGITGEWQVHGRSRTTFDEMVRMDLRYIRNQSLWLDLKILLKTPFAVLSGDGAY